jgi:hypothetical protein
VNTRLGEEVSSRQETCHAEQGLANCASSTVSVGDWVGRVMRARTDGFGSHSCCTGTLNGDIRHGTLLNTCFDTVQSLLLQEAVLVVLTRAWEQKRGVLS